MSLSKNQMIAAVSAGVFVLAAGALGWFLYDAITVRGEQEDELERQLSSFRRYNDAAVFPSHKTISQVNTNKEELVAWREAAHAYAARGDRSLAAETPPIFKQRLAATVRKMGALRGAASGHLAVQNFMFGFEAYLGDGGALPDVKDVPRLAAQLDTIKHVVVTLAKAGALEIKEVTRIEPKEDKDDEKGRGGRASARANGKAGRSRQSAKDGAKPATPDPTCLEYKFSFTVRPDAFVKVLNALSSGERFLIVKDFAFRDVADDISVQMAAADAAKAAAAQAAAGTGRRGGSRRRAALLAAAAAENNAEEPETKSGGVVCDPESGSPIQVDMTIAAWDFGTKAAGQQESRTAGQQESKTVGQQDNRTRSPQHKTNH